MEQTVFEQKSSSVASSSQEGEAMPIKMSVITAIELVMALGFTSGDPVMWKLVKALRDGVISPAGLQRRN